MMKFCKTYKNWPFVTIALSILMLACNQNKSNSAEGVNLPECEPENFVLQQFEKKMEEKASSYEPKDDKQLLIFQHNFANEDFQFNSHILPEEAGKIDVQKNGVPTILVKINPAPSGARAEFGFFSKQSEGTDLSDFRNGTIHFSLKGPKYADVELQFEASGGMYVYGQTTEQNLLLNGQWQDFTFPLHFFDRMIAPGANYVVPFDYGQVTAPFKLSAFVDRETQFEIRNVYLSNQPPKKDPIMDEIYVLFDQPINDWDGFGVNYVESSRSRDYQLEPEDYSGFSNLSEEQRKEVINLVFGEDGLQPSLLKMFLDPLHEKAVDGEINEANLANAYDHQTTTKFMRYFAKEGMELSRKQGIDLTVMAGMYGPPAWSTKQKFVRGRDLDSTRYEDLALYMASWVKFLKEKEGLPVKFLSIHNEGDSPNRWDEEGKTAGKESHDHNAYWRPNEVVNFVQILDDVLDNYGLEEVGVTPGEYNTWHKFYTPEKEAFQYAKKLYKDEEALNSIELITSHSFWNPTDIGINLLHLKRPELHVWTTSFGWNWGRGSDVSYFDFIRREIYDVRVNGFINWAISYSPNKWTGEYPNPGTGIFIDSGSYRIEPAYYNYKQLTRAGRGGTKVVKTISAIPNVNAIAFSGNQTGYPDAFVVYNMNNEPRDVVIKTLGSGYKTFEGFMNEPCTYEVPLGDFKATGGGIQVKLKPYSSIVFFGK